MKKILNRFVIYMLAVFLVLSMVPHSVHAKNPVSLEVVSEFWGTEESSFAVRCSGIDDVSQITVWAAIFRGPMFYGFSIAESVRADDELFYISVKHLPFEAHDQASVKLFLLDAENFAPQVEAPVEEHIIPEKEVHDDGRVVRENQTYRSVYSSEVSTLNYLASDEDDALAIAANCIDPLVENDPYGNIIPCGATSWSVENEKYVDHYGDTCLGQKWTFKIREGQKWYDSQGNEMGDVTAHDYVAAIRYVANAAYGCADTEPVETWVRGASEAWAYTYASCFAVPMGEEVMDEELGYSQYVFDDDGVVYEVIYNDDWTAVESYVELLKVLPEDIMCVAEDDYTLVYHLTAPCAYFLTVVSEACYWPAPSDQLDNWDIDFGSDNATMWYNGAYRLKTFEPWSQRVMVKNEHNWDAEHIYIASIEQRYQEDAAAAAAQLFSKGLIDGADIRTAHLENWENVEQQILPVRPNTDYYYFYTLNFEPRFDEQYEPENWSVAVNNENFRQALKSGLDRKQIYQAEYPEYYDMLMQNTITPAGYYMNEGKDYVNHGALAAISAGQMFDEAVAVEYMKQAIPQILRDGGHFPVIVLVQHNGSEAWEKRSELLKENLEELFNLPELLELADSDAILQVEVNNYGSGGFLSGTRRSGNFALQECNWGSDYADPETWTDPFMADNTYGFAYDTTDRWGVSTKSAETQAIQAEYERLVELAKEETLDLDARYKAFAKAEAYYLEHAMVIPYGTTGFDWMVTRLNPFDGQFAVYGHSAQRFKGMKINETATSTTQYEEMLEAWEDEMNRLFDDEEELPDEPVRPSIANAEYSKDYVSLYSQFGDEITIDDVIEEEGVGYIERDGVRYTLGMDFLSRAMVYNTTVPADGEWETEDDVYADWWRLYITRWNYLLPEIPLYANKVYDLYNAQIKGVEEHPTNPFWSPSAALIDWTSEKEDGSIILGSSTELSGKLRYATFGVNSPGSSDLDVQNLIVGLETVATTKEGGYMWNPTVVAEHDETDNADGSRTHTIKIHEDLKFSDGSSVTAKNYLVNVLTFSTPVAAQAAGKAHMAGMTYVGFEDFNAYTGPGSEDGKKEFSGIRLIDDYTFSVTIAADYLPYFYAIIYGGFSAVPTALYLGEADIMDDGNGVYLSDEFYAKDGDSYTMAQHVYDGAWDKSTDYPYSGPYMIESWNESDKSVVLVANPNFKGNYEGTKPGIQKVIYKPMYYDTCMEELQAGELDVFAGSSSGGDIQRIMDLVNTFEGKFVYTCYDRAAYGKLAFRADLGPAQFEEVRRAIAYCMDRDQYAEDFTGGYGTVIHAPYYTGSWMYKKAAEKDMQLNTYNTSLEKAIAELEKGGWVYNVDGSAYSGYGVRYKKISDSEMYAVDKDYTSVDGTYACVQIGTDWYMPLVLNWYGTSDNYMTELLVSGFMQNENIIDAGFDVQYTFGGFSQMLDELYQMDIYGYYGGVPTYNCFNFTTGFTSAAYDYSYNWTIDPEEYDSYSICYLKDQADVYWLQ